MESTQPSSAEKKQARRRRIRRPLSSQPTAPVSSGGAENATENKSGEKPLPTLKVRPPRELDPREPITSGEPVSTPKLDASKQRFSTLGKSGGLVVAPPCVDCRAAPRTVTYLCCKSLLRCVACHVRAESTSCVRCGLDYHYMGGFISARYF